MIKCNEGFISPGEIIHHTKWVDENDDAAIVASVRRMAKLSHDPYLADAHCGGIGRIDTIEDLMAAHEGS